MARLLAVLTPALAHLTAFCAVASPGVSVFGVFPVFISLYFKHCVLDSFFCCFSIPYMSFPLCGLDHYSIVAGTYHAMRFSRESASPFFTCIF